MKIVHITFSLGNGGKENMMVDIANQHQKKGHDVTIIVLNKNADDSVVNRIDPNISYRNFKRDKSKLIKTIQVLIQLFVLFNIKKNHDIIHAHDPGLGKLLKLLSPKPKILTIHGVGFDLSPMKYFSKLIAISYAVKFDIERIKTLKSEVIFNGIKTNNVDQKTSWKLNNVIRIVNIGRLDIREKGQDILIDAISMLKKESFKQKVKVDIIGEGISRNFLENKIRENSLQSTVHILGNKSRSWIYQNYKIYDIFILSSKTEGFGLTIAEAMAAKLPVISSSIEGPLEILNYGKHGLLFKKNSVENLANKINKMVVLYENGNIENLVEKAYKYCIANYDIKRTSEEYLNQYKKIIESV